MNKGSMTPARILVNAKAPDTLSSGRAWQGIPSVERTRGGRLYAAWYSGMKSEEPGNFVVLEKSDDDGATWTDAWAIIRHDDPNVRCFDQALWLDPLGRLWVAWTQSAGAIFDGRDGVWVSVIDDPDAETPVFGEIRRIANGLMLNKPTVLKNGEWLFPCALWNTHEHDASEAHPELAYEALANVYVTSDQGKTFSWRGGADVPDRVFDEHMVVELRDGRLWMVTRVTRGLGESYSSDGGHTWEQSGFSGHTGPNSRAYVRRLASGRILMVNHMNPTYLTSPKGWNRRDNLCAMLSEDDGRTWRGLLVLDARNEVSYPDGTEDENGFIYVIHDFERYKAREILLSKFTEDDILAGGLVTEGSWLRRVVSKATGKQQEAN